MTAARLPWAADMLHFWFHELRPDQWFGRSALVDEALRRRFGRALAMLGGRAPGDFLGDPLTARAARTTCGAPSATPTREHRSSGSPRPPPTRLPTTALRFHRSTVIVSAPLSCCGGPRAGTRPGFS